MKIEIDTEAKEIKVAESITISELVSALKKLFPNDEWKEFKLVPTVVEKWNNYPILKPQSPYQPYVAPTIQPNPYDFTV